MRRVLLFVVLAAALGLIAALSPAPDRITDRDVYEAHAARLVVPDCTDLHCFRVLVPWVLGRFPQGTATWKAYAAVSNAFAAVALFELCLALGFTRHGASMAAVMAAFGFGSLYTLHDPHTSDPLMYALGPAITYELVRDRVALAGAMGGVGVLAKEFAAAPLFIFAGCSMLARRWELAARVTAAAAFAFIVWLMLTLTLMLRFNYGYGDSPSTQLLSGGNLVGWMGRQSLLVSLVAVFNEYSVVYLLAAVGLIWFAPPLLRQLAAAAVLPALLFAYVQQPDRALWNFHYVMLPLAALVLERVSRPLGWTIAITFAFANLRIGAQLPMVPGARWALACSVIAGVAATGIALRDRFAASAAGEHAAVLR